MKKRNINDILAMSKRATCGITERELVEKSSKVASTIKKLQGAGYNVLGTSYAKAPTKKIWFIIKGGI